MPDYDAFLQAIEQADASGNLRYGRQRVEGDVTEARAAIPIDTADTNPAADYAREEPNIPQDTADTNPAALAAHERGAGGPIRNSKLRDAGREGRGVAVANERAGRREGDVGEAILTSMPQDTADVRGERIKVATNSGDGGRDSLGARYAEEDKSVPRRAGRQDAEDARRQGASNGVPFTDPAKPDMPVAEGPKKPKVTQAGKTASPKKSNPTVAAAKGGKVQTQNASLKEGNENSDPTQNSTGTGAGGPLLPDYGDNPSLDQRNAMNAAELKKQGKTGPLQQFLAPERTARSVDAGLKDIARHYGFAQQRQAIDGASPQPQNQQAMEAYARGSDAMPPAELRQFMNHVDPNNELKEDARLIATMNATYDYYMNKGQPQKAAAVQRGILMHIKSVVSRGGAVAQVALERGNVKGAANVIAQSYSMIPDGKTMQIKGVGQDGSVHYAITDEQTGELTQQGKAKVNQLMYLATGMQNGSLWFEQMTGITQKAAAARSAAAREGRAVRAEERSIASVERQERRYEENDRRQRRREEFQDKSNAASQQWVGHVQAIQGLKSDLLEAQQAGDAEGVKRIQEELKGATAAAADFLKSSPEAARQYESQFQSLTRQGYSARKASGTGTGTGRSGKSILDSMEPEAVDEAITTAAGFKQSLKPDARFAMRNAVVDIADNNRIGVDEATVLAKAAVGGQIKPLGNDVYDVNGQQIKLTKRGLSEIARLRAMMGGGSTQAPAPTGGGVVSPAQASTPAPQASGAGRPSFETPAAQRKREAAERAEAAKGPGQMTLDPRTTAKPEDTKAVDEVAQLKAELGDDYRPGMSVNQMRKALFDKKAEATSSARNDNRRKAISTFGAR